MKRIEINPDVSRQPSIGLSRVRALVVEAAPDQPTSSTPRRPPSNGPALALRGMTVGALAPISYGAGATIAYLEPHSPDRRPDGDLLTAVTYFHAAVDSPVHEQIKDVSAAESAIGHQATVDKCRQLVADLETRLADEPVDRLVAALGGRLLTLDDFCRTRLIEVLLHLDDLAVSTGQTRRTPTRSASHHHRDLHRHRPRAQRRLGASSPDPSRRSRDTAGLPVF